MVASRVKYTVTVTADCDYSGVTAVVLSPTPVLRRLYELPLVSRAVCRRKRLPARRIGLFARVAASGTDLLIDSRARRDFSGGEGSVLQGIGSKFAAPI